jgi:hypothetical protein
MNSFKVKDLMTSVLPGTGKLNRMGDCQFSIAMFGCPATSKFSPDDDPCPATSKAKPDDDDSLCPATSKQNVKANYRQNVNEIAIGNLRLADLKEAIAFYQ